MLNSVRFYNSCRAGRTISWLGASRNSSSIVDITGPEGITLSNDRKTIICWHPERKFPYECSQPLPETISNDDHSVLKVQLTPALKHIYRPKTAELERQELMKLTYTTKHIWFPISRKHKEKKTEMDRPYL